MLVGLSLFGLAFSVAGAEQEAHIGSLLPDPDDKDPIDVPVKLARALALVGAPRLRFSYGG